MTFPASAELITPDGGKTTISLEEQGPSEEPNIVQIAVGSDTHTTLVSAVQAAGLVDVLANEGPFTVFAPTNEAFEALPEGTIEDLLKPENKNRLMEIIEYHTAPGNYGLDSLTDGMSLYHKSGDPLKIEDKGGKMTVNGATILGSVEATNGIVYIVDKVLLPPDQ